MLISIILIVKFQHTATRRWLQTWEMLAERNIEGFNTQPPEGGCEKLKEKPTALNGFNTQPPEGGCIIGEVFYE